LRREHEVAGVSELRKAIVGEYTAALRESLAGRGENALQRAYEAGRRGLADGFGVVEIAAAYQQAFEDVLRENTGRNREAALRTAWGCLAESLSPFEMVLRGVRDSNARLHNSLLNLQSLNQKLLAAKIEIERERRRYHGLFEFAPDAYLVTTFDGVIREANTAAATLLSFERELLAGRELATFVSEPDHDTFLQRLSEFENGAIQKLEAWPVSIQTPGRLTFPAVLTAAAERDSRVLRWMIRDATEQKRTEQERARSLVGRAKAHAAGRLEVLASASALLAEATDLESALQSVADLAVPGLGAMCFISVVRDDQSLDQVAAAHAHKADGEIFAALGQHRVFARTRFATTTAAQAITPEWCESAAENETHAILLRRLTGRAAVTAPLRSRDRLLGVIAFISKAGQRSYRQLDIALAEDLARRCSMAIENARLYREVSAQRDKAEKASRAKDEFLAILSHELRNPLMPLKGWTRALKSNAAIAQDETLGEGLSSMERSVAALERLVNDCLDLTRISEGRIGLDRRGVDLHEIALICLESVREFAAQKNITLEHRFRPQTAPVFADSVRLQQVIMNLLVNALKYTPERGSVLLSSSGSDQEVVLEVIDTGIGIEPDFMDQLFEPFRRGRNSNESGLGLGLAIARTIVELHGGRIIAESDGVNRGSRFRVVLPKAAGHVEIIKANSPRPASTGVHRTILLIEDSEDIRFLLQTELERRGYSVIVAADGASGLQRVRLDRPDLVISDIKMPGIDGLALIREIRALPELCSIPAIALTGLASKSEVERAVAAGFDACVNKPAEPDELVEVIESLARERDLLRA
jgi:PAS domain S-box-containing protein